MVLNISRNLDQAQEMYNYAKGFVLQDEKIAETFLLKTPAATRMIFRNKSVVRAMGCRIPYADNIRGKRAHLYFLDEAILIYNKMFDAIEPITTWTKGHRVYITTAGRQDCYFFKLKLMIEKGLVPNAKLFVLPACKEREDGTLYDPICPVLTIEELEQKRRERGKLRFGREYLCKWIGAANQLFQGFKTYDYKKPKESSKPCYGGIDVGRVQNPTVFILLEYQGKDQPYRLIYCKAWYQKPFEVVANSILKCF